MNQRSDDTRRDYGREAQGDYYGSPSRSTQQSQSDDNRYGQSGWGSQDYGSQQRGGYGSQGSGQGGYGGQ
jgi:hypothetical protein